MPLYMYQAAYTPASWAAQLKNPENRMGNVVRGLCESAGGKLVGAWYCFGDYDITVISDDAEQRKHDGDGVGGRRRWFHQELQNDSLDDRG
jgi:uncharacterized protein with GYD domain